MDSPTRNQFPGLTDTVYLNTAVMAAGATPVRTAYESALQAWSAGRFQYVTAENAGEKSREMFAKLIGGSKREIAIIPTVSAAAGTVAAQLKAAKPGENIVVGEEEYTSNFFPWVQLKDYGYEIRSVPFQNGAPAIDAIAQRVDQKTRLLAISAVQSASGAAADLSALSEIIHKGGGWLFVDASQAVGALPLNVRTSDIDFLATSSHKFLCGTRGMGYLYVREELLPAIRPVGPGWKAAALPLQSFFGPRMDLSPSASKLDMSLVWFAALGDEAAFQMIEQIGTDRLFEMNRFLVRALRERLKERGFDVPAADEPVKSTILSIPLSDSEEVSKRLQQANIVTSVRAGRLRISIHHYNTLEDLDRLTRLL